MTEKTTEVFIASPSNTTAKEVATEILGQCEIAIYDDFKSVPAIFLAHDQDLSELAFTVGELYSMKKISGPSKAFKVKVSVVVEELIKK